MPAAPFLTTAARNALSVDPKRQQAYYLMSHLADPLATLPRVVHVDYAPQPDGAPGAYVMNVQALTADDEPRAVAQVAYMPSETGARAWVGRGKPTALTPYSPEAAVKQVEEWASEDAAALAAA